MSNPVLAALANARQAESDADDRTLTAAALANLKLAPPDGDKSHFATWRTWCAGKGIVDYPALPAAIAVYLINNAGLGERLAMVVASISAVHQSNGKADPTLSPVVIAALATVSPPIEAPSSFPKEMKAQFTQLPRPLQKFVAEHTRKIVTEMRKAQNAASKQKDKNGLHQQDTPAAAGNTDAPIQNR